MKANVDAVSNGAYFLAAAYHEAYQSADEQIFGTHIESWGSVSIASKRARAAGFQTLFDLRVLAPIPLVGVRALKVAGFDCAASLKDRFGN